jgi:hypothetical protein
VRKCKHCEIESDNLDLFVIRKGSKHGRINVCRVCYNIRRRQRFAERRELVDSIKSQPCADCGISYPPYVMDFDHVRGEKSFELGSRGDRSAKALLAEIEKCDVVCANCHRLRTHARRLAGSDYVSQAMADGQSGERAPTPPFVRDWV